MIKSMTGFGQGEASGELRKFTVEIKAVNHRYLDLSVKMPKKFNFFEASIRNLMKEYAQRGKVDMYISYEDLVEKTVNIQYHPEVAASYMNYLKEISREFEVENDIKAVALSRFPEVLTMEEQEFDEEGIWKDLEAAIRIAAEAFAQSRCREGENLKQDLLEKLDIMLSHVAYIEEKSPKIIEEYREKLKEKVADLLEDNRVDENRLVMEVTLFADKVCVDEELVRLKSHIQMVKNTLIEGGSIGRKLDFIVQEMNREANTILSKSTDLEISNRGIELKTEIEKVREQIQNIE